MYNSLICSPISQTSELYPLGLSNMLIVHRRNAHLSWDLLSLQSEIRDFSFCGCGGEV